MKPAAENFIYISETCTFLVRIVSFDTAVYSEVTAAGERE